MLALRSLASLGDGTPVRVLDAGAGDGLLSLAIAERHPSWTVVAADVREDALERGRADADRDGIGNVRFERLDLTRPIPEGGYDVVLALECLEEIRRRRGGHRGLRRRAATGRTAARPCSGARLAAGAGRQRGDLERRGPPRLHARRARRAARAARAARPPRDADDPRHGAAGAGGAGPDQDLTARGARRGVRPADAPRSGSSGSASRGGRPARSTRRRGSRREAVPRPRGGRAGRAGRSAELLGADPHLPERGHRRGGRRVGARADAPAVRGGRLRRRLHGRNRRGAAPLRRPHPSTSGGRTPAPLRHSTAAWRRRAATSSSCSTRTTCSSLSGSRRSRSSPRRDPTSTS